MAISPVASSEGLAPEANRFGYLPAMYLLSLLADEPLLYSILNDTGITWGGYSLIGDNASCAADPANPQDCNQGRDATDNDDSDGHAGFSFTKLDASGEALAASAIGWSCVKDNVTGLIWEVKTDDGGIHDKAKTYQWGGKTHLGTGFGTYYDGWDTLVDGSNSGRFCGYSDWRVPTNKELKNLANLDRIDPTIDAGYFPNTQALDFWSASPSAISSGYAWGVDFNDGSSSNLSNRGHYKLVRLVRSGQ